MGTGGETALVATKLTPPTLPGGLVERPRLREALEAAVADPAVRVVLVSAPAGSGKSTLVASWQHAGSGGAWLQADSADRDAARFWAHVVAALDQPMPGLNDALQPHVAHAAIDPGPLIDRLANELADAQPATLIIDDFHLVASPAIDDAVERLIQLSPATFTLVVLTRLDPAIRLSRLRVTGGLVEIRAHDLRFLEDEASALLSRATAADALAGVEDEQVRLLCDRTEGWAAGLVLARLSLAGAGDQAAFIEDFRGDDRLVVDYLTDEFLAQTDQEERDRLLATSVLDELSGPLIDAVCASTGGGAWLEDLAGRNQLVIGLGRSGDWYRYHHLLRDVLRLKAAGSQPMDELHRRAGVWHRDHGDLDRAAEHLLEAGDLETAADVVAAHSMDLLNLGQIETVSGYLHRLGPAAEAHLLCSVIVGWIQAVTGQLDLAQRSLTHIRALEAERPGDEFTTGLVAGLGVMIHLGRGDVTSAIADATEAPAVTDATQTLVLGQAFAWGGRFDDARPILDRSASLAVQNDDRFALAGVPSMTAVTALESGDADTARRLAAQTIDAVENLGTPEGGHEALARSVLARTADDDDAARDEARRCPEAARRAAGKLTTAYALAGAGDVLCALGEPDGPDLVNEARSIIDQSPDPGIVGRYLARVEARHQLASQPVEAGLIEELTDRELAVLRYLPSPMSQRDIATELYVSLNTVKTHCRAIYRKLAVTDRKAAVQAARDAGLL